MEKWAGACERGNLTLVGCPHPHITYSSLCNARNPREVFIQYPKRLDHRLISVIVLSLGPPRLMGVPPH
jgi:hypothetical protein